MRQKIVIFFRIVWFTEFLRFCGKGSFQRFEHLLETLTFHGVTEITSNHCFHGLTEITSNHCLLTCTTPPSYLHVLLQTQNHYSLIDPTVKITKSVSQITKRRMKLDNAVM